MRYTKGPNHERGPSLLSKYTWVINTILRAGKISYRNLNEKWERDYDFSRGKELPKRTLDNWRAAILDLFGINIENEQCGTYRYFINNDDGIRSNALSRWLYNTFSVGNTILGCQKIKERILLEDVPSGQEYLQPIIDAMKENRVLHITYRKYGQEEETMLDIQPFCMKIFRQRWYVAAKPNYEDAVPYIFSLDRIVDLRPTANHFNMPTDWDADNYFDGCFGIIVDQNEEKQVVRLKVSAAQAHYFRDLPLHESQVEEYDDEAHSTFTYFLRPTYDFIQELLKYGDTVEILEPLWCRKDIAECISRMYDTYHRRENKPTKRKKQTRKIK